jgi:hypothetical protein
MLSRNNEKPNTYIPTIIILQPPLLSTAVAPAISEATSLGIGEGIGVPAAHGQTCLPVNLRDPRAFRARQAAANGVCNALGHLSHCKAPVEARKQ